MGSKSKLMRMLAAPKAQCARCWNGAPNDAAFCPACGAALELLDATDDAVLVQADALLNDDPLPDVQVDVALPIPCGGCSKPLEPDARFCHACGHAQQRARSAKGTQPLGGFGLSVETRHTRLAVLNADGSVRRIWPLTREVALIGSSEGDVQLGADPFVASKHARIERRGAQWFLEPLQTTNGVYLRLSGAADLEAGDYFRAGKQLFRVTSNVELFGSGPPPLPPTDVRFFGSPDEQLMLYLAQITTRRRVGHLVSLSQRPRVIGRDMGDLVFPRDEFMSGRHVQVEALSEKRARLTDLGSTNGVYLRVIEATALSHGALLCFGETLVRFEVS